MKKVIILLIIISYSSFSQYQWEQTNGKFGQNINCITTDGAHVYAGISGGGVFLSTDSGNSWTSKNRGLTNTDIYSIAISGNNIFAGTFGGGVFLSADNGNSWTPKNSGLTDSNIRVLAVNGNNLYACTSGGGVFLSTDNGNNWLPKNSNLPFADILSIAINGNNIFVSANGGFVFLSTDNGDNWVEKRITMTKSIVFSMISIGKNIFAGTMDGIFLSTDDGKSWIEKNVGLSNISIRSFAVNGNEIYAGTFGGGVFRSTDNGDSWVPKNSGFTTTDISSLAINGNEIYAGTFGGGIFRSSDNGRNWTIANSGLTNGVIASLAFSGNTLFAATNNGGLFLSKDNGSSWAEINVGLSYSYISSLLINGKSVYMGTNSGIFLSKDNGLGWAEKNSGLIDSIIVSFAISDNNIFAGSWLGRIYLSINNGENWIVKNFGIMNTPITTLAISSNNVFAGTPGEGVFLSTDFGDTWTAKNFGLTNKNITSISISGKNIFIGTYGGVFLSTDNGEKWTSKDSGLTNENIRTIVIIGKKIFAGTDGGGVFVSTNDGDSWTSENTGLNNLYVLNLVGEKDYLFAGTDGSGVFRVKIPSAPLSSIQLINPQTDNFCLNREYNLSYKTTGIFETDNEFIVQLSDDNGNFSTPKIIGRKQSISTDSIKISFNSITSSSYEKIRIISTNPACTSNVSKQLFLSDKISFESLKSNLLCMGDEISIKVNNCYNSNAGNTYSLELKPYGRILFQSNKINENDIIKFTVPEDIEEKIGCSIVLTTTNPVTSNIIGDNLVVSSCGTSDSDGLSISNCFIGRIRIGEMGFGYVQIINNAKFNITIDSIIFEQQTPYLFLNSWSINGIEMGGKLPPTKYIMKSSDILTIKIRFFAEFVGLFRSRLNCYNSTLTNPVIFSEIMADSYLPCEFNVQCPDLSFDPANSHNKYIKLDFVVEGSNPQENTCNGDSIYAWVKMYKSMFLPKEKNFSDDDKWRTIEVRQKIDTIENGKPLFSIEGTILLGDTIETPVIVDYFRFSSGYTNTTFLNGKITLINIPMYGQYPRLMTFGNIIVKNIYPNPAGDDVNIIMELNAKCLITLEIVAPIGIVMDTKNYELSKGINNVNLSMKGLPVGSYKLNIKEENKIQTFILNVIR